MNWKRRSLVGLVALVLSISFIVHSSVIYAADEELDAAPESAVASDAAEVDETVSETEAESDSISQTLGEEESTADVELEAMSLDMSAQAAAATAPTQLWVEPSDANGIPVRIDVFKNQVQTGGSTWNPTYTIYYQLCLPGNAILGNCFISWDGGATVTMNGETYESGSCPIPPLNEETTLVFKSETGQQLTSLDVTAYQGSASVTPVFIVIDESGDNPTIAQMDGDTNHNVTCTGTIYIDGTLYTLDKMKGRGNATWKESKDKKPYNITLGSKINFPGIDSAKTKKWSLLAECLDRSLLGNRSGYHLAHELGIGQDTASADVWMNGEYQGCYTVTPKTDSFVTKSGFMIEQDNYLEDSVANGGDPQFTLDGLKEASGWSSCYNRITVKKMGDDLLTNNGVVDESPENVEAAAGQIQTWLQDAWDAIRSDTGYNAKGKYYTDYIDIESFAKMYLMHEYVKSYDVCAGSILFHRDGNTDADKLIAGPLWDLDNAMGSVYQNSSLGQADDRRNGDRRSGEGTFIANVTEYKTSIYKTIGKHSDFMDEVERQYNKYKWAFDALESDTNEMAVAIEASARMNHKKVIDLGNGTGKNNHYYSSNTTLGSGQYRQSYVATTDWGNYTANLKTYIATRSLWFANTYYDPSFVDPADCDHQYEKVAEVPATCKSAGSATYTCPICKDSYTETLPKIAHTYENGACTVCNEVLRSATITCDAGASVTVYETQEINEACEANATIAYPRDGDTGLIDCSGGGQVNFVVNLKPGYVLDSVTAEPTGSYKNLKGPDDTGVANGYRITKVSGDFTINVTTLGPKFRSHSLLLSGQIGVKFYMDLSDLSEEQRESCKMDFTVCGKEQTDTYDPNDMNSSKTYYGFTCYIKSIEMADEIAATFSWDDGKTISQTYSAKGYIDKFEEDASSFSDKAQDLIEAIADYGYYVQPFLAQAHDWTIGTDHAPMEAANAYSDTDIENVASETSGYAIVKSIPGESAVTKVTYSLDLKDTTSIYLYFAVQEGSSVTAAHIENGSPVKPELRFDGRYRVAIKNIPAHKLGDTYVVTATVSDGTEVEIRVSALSYVRSILANSTDPTARNAVASIYYYWAATKDYRISEGID